MRTVAAAKEEAEALSLKCCCPTMQLLILVLLLLLAITSHGFQINESTIHDIHLAFRQNQLTSRRLVEYYLDQIRSLNPLLHAVIEVNPDALHQADRTDEDRRRYGIRGGLHGIPVLVKDNIATKDRLNTTAGSLALLGSVVPRDAGVVKGLRRAGAVILGKASLSEWANFRSISAPNGWSGRGGQPKNPYVLSGEPCGSSTGSAIAAAANMAAVTLGSETDGSIICPSSYHSVVGIKPTVGLTSRAGVIPITPRQDTIGPIGRTVSDAVYVLDAIVGYDPRDSKATRKASKFIPPGGYMQFLKVDGLKGKRLGIPRKQFFNFPNGHVMAETFEKHFKILRQSGAILVDNLKIANADVILDGSYSGEEFAMVAEFKLALNEYLSELSESPVRTLADVIAFNNKHKHEERINNYGQEYFLKSQKTNGIDAPVRRAIREMARLSKDGIETLMKVEHLDAVVTPDAAATSVLAIGGYPGISVPAGYGSDGVPFGICFGGLQGSEPKLIQIAYAFEQATKVRVPPSFKP